MSSLINLCIERDCTNDLFGSPSNKFCIQHYHKKRVDWSKASENATTIRQLVTYMEQAERQAKKNV
jgi:hypothetical protein